MLAMNILHIFYKYVTICSVFVLYEKKMENQKKIKKINKIKKSFFFFLSNWEFLYGIGEKNILFSIRNGAEFQPQNRVRESPVKTGFTLQFKS